MGLGISLVYRFTGVGLPCLFRLVTGWECPFCGATRMGAALLHGDILTAWRSNAVLLIACGLLGIRSIGWIVEWARHPQYTRRWLPAGVDRHALVIAGVIAVAWTVLRNLV